MKLSPRTTNPAWNYFHLYSNMPNAKKGNASLKKNVDTFLREHKRIAKKYGKEGAGDSAVRDAVVSYVLKNLY